MVASYDDDGVQIINITDPDNLTAVANITDGSAYPELEGATAIATHTIGTSHYALVASQDDDGVQIINITTPASPSAVASITDGADYPVLDEARGITTHTIGSSHYALVASLADDGVQIIDITDPANPSAVVNITDGSTYPALDGAYGITTHTIGNKHYALVASQIDDGVQIINITTPSSPSAVASVTDGADYPVLDGARGITTHTIGASHYALVAAQNDDGVQIIDITDPANPSAVANVTDSAGYTELNGAEGITTHAIGTRLYALVAAQNDDGVQMIDITDPAIPFDPLLPYVELALSGDRRATYSDSDNTDANLVFEYTVREGDSTTDLAYKATTSLKLGANTLTDADDGAEISAVTLPAPGATNSLSANKDIELNQDGALRLVNGTLTDDDGRKCEGRLEILLNGEWGTICDDYWTVENADVACRQLGFVGGAVDDWHRFRNSFFPPGASDQQIVLDDTNCEGYESNLLDCPSRQPGEHNCQHFEDVGLRCIKNSEGPHVTNIEISGPPGGDGTYDEDDVVTITLVWSEPVEVELDVPPENPPPGCCHDGPPRVWLSYAEYVRTFNIANYHPSPYASYTSGSGTDRLVFTNTISEFAGKTSFPWVAVIHESLQLRSSRITSVATGKPVILGHRWHRSAGTGMQAEAATIRGVPTFNDPGADGVFGAGERVEVTFTFNQPVRVDTAGGVPSVAVLLSGTGSRQAPYLRGSGTGQLVFAYTLAAGDGEHTSLLVEPNALTLNGGAIRDTANDLDADIGHQGGGTLFVLQTDDAGPQLQSAAVDASSLTLTFDEELDNANPPSSGLFTVNVNGTSRSVMAVGVGQSEVILLLATAVEAGDAVTVDYSLPTEETAARCRTLEAARWSPSAGGR